MHFQFSRLASDTIPSSPEKWTLLNNLLTTPRSKQIDLGTVTHASLTDFKRKDSWSTKLTLKTPTGSTTINCTDWLDGDSRQRCFSLILAILNSLERCNPTLKVVWGYSQLRRCLQSMAILPLLGCAAALLLACMANALVLNSYGVTLTTEEIVRTAIISIVPLCVLLFLAWVVWNLAPWRTSRKLTPDAMQDLIEGQPGMMGRLS